jgi:hypothetical protein
MADDDINMLRRDDAGGCGDDMGQQGLAADLMEDFGAAGLESGSLAGRHDDDGQLEG